MYHTLLASNLRLISYFPSINLVPKTQIDWLKYSAMRITCPILVFYYQPATSYNILTSVSCLVAVCHIRYFCLLAFLEHVFVTQPFGSGSLPLFTCPPVKCFV